MKNPIKKVTSKISKIPLTKSHYSIMGVIFFFLISIIGFKIGYSLALQKKQSQWEKEKAMMEIDISYLKSINTGLEKTIKDIQKTEAENDKKIEEESKKQEVEKTPVTFSIGLDTYAKFKWQVPEKIESLKFFTNDAEDYYKDSQTQYYRTATIIEGRYKGADLILMESPCNDMMCGPMFSYLVKKDSRLIMLTKHDWAKIDTSKIYNAEYSIDADYEINELIYPETITFKNPRQILIKNKWDGGFFDDTNLAKFLFHEKYGQIYTTKKDFEEKNSFFTNNGFYLKAADGTTRVYTYEPDFITNNTVPTITWTDGTKNDDGYTDSDTGGCGSINYISVSHTVNPEDLKKTGTNNKGDAIYELKNPEHPILKDIYENRSISPIQIEEAPSYGETSRKPTYEEFVAGHPIFFWNDPFGRLIKFESETLIFHGECGKPVIYLYPEKTTNVKVQISPQGGLTKTEPLYEDSWLVEATAQGQLTDLKTGQKYPYLFWEGRGGLYQEPEKGWIVKQRELHSFLMEKLALYGLNQRETSDFMEFWEPKMHDSPYYFITFWGNPKMDEIAPLTIEPQPDTVLRILMDFWPVEKPYEVKPPRITTPARKGFTVVEWGGILR